MQDEFPNRSHHTKHQSTEFVLLTSNDVGNSLCQGVCTKRPAKNEVPLNHYIGASSKLALLVVQLLIAVKEMHV